MTTPGFRQIYISSLDEPGLHGPKQIGHPDRQVGGEHYVVRARQPWTDDQVRELIRLWEDGLHHRAIHQAFIERGIPHSRDNVQRKLTALSKEGALKRISKRGGYRPRVN